MDDVTASIQFSIQKASILPRQVSSTPSGSNMC